MKFIAHRGNTNGPNKEEENKPSYVKLALDKGYEAEIDVWKIGEQLYLGHNEPQYETTIDFISDNRLWCHAKNVEALLFMLNNNIHCFWHQEDDYTITSNGYVWCYPGKPTYAGSVCVMPEKYNSKVGPCYAVCSDFQHYVPQKKNC